MAVWLGALLLCVLPALAAPVAGTRLAFGITGSADGEGVRNPTNLLHEAVIQDLVLALAQAPLPEDKLRAALVGSEASIANLVETGLIAKRADGTYGIAFALFTAEDGRLIHAVTTRAAASLADALLRDRAAFEQILARYDMPIADRRMVAMALIGCALLDWNGLTITHDAGLRREGVDRGALGRYSVWASEKADDLSIRGLYWGSHNDLVGPAWFTSFGDHHSLPRLALPDMNWTIGSDAIDARYSRPLRVLMATSIREGLAATQADAIKLMMALRDGGISRAALLQAAGVGAEPGDRALRLLGELHYVRPEGDRISSRIPIFAARDKPLVHAVNAKGGAIFKTWLAKNAPEIRKQLTGLSALQAGVSYEELFTQIYHHIFGRANLELARRGFVSDPYGPETPFTGFIPFVWDASLKLND